MKTSSMLVVPIWKQLGGVIHFFPKRPNSDSAHVQGLGQLLGIIWVIGAAQNRLLWAHGAIWTWAKKSLWALHGIKRGWVLTGFFWILSILLMSKCQKYSRRGQQSFRSFRLISMTALDIAVLIECHQLQHYDSWLFTIFLVLDETISDLELQCEAFVFVVLFPGSKYICGWCYFDWWSRAHVICTNSNKVLLFANVLELTQLLKARSI